MLINKILKFVMKKFFVLLHVFIICVFFNSGGFAKKSNFFEKGKVLFDKEEFEKSKILFEKDLVFNPKSENAYLYLAKIHIKNSDDEGQEMNLNNVLLLNPQNDEAIYLLILLKIKQSDYSRSKKLISKFNLVCKSFCPKRKEIEKKFNKLVPRNEENNN